MLEASFLIDGALIFTCGMWPLMLVLGSAAVRAVKTRRTASAGA